MTVLKNKIDFVAIVSVKMANPNGDPLNENQPRTNYDGYGEISDVCIKRKIRNRMQDLGEDIFVQSDDRVDDGQNSLRDRVEHFFPEYKKKFKTKEKDSFKSNACLKWLDVRSFGQVFAFKKDKKEDKSSNIVGIRGPVSVHTSFSVSPVEIESMQITKSVNGVDNNGKKGEDTMGFKHFVKFGVYQINGSINVQLAEKTSFTEEDAEILKECLRTLFVNDASSARPDGSMEIKKLYWFKHNCKDGQYSAAKVHNSISLELKEGVDYPTCYEDYSIVENFLDGLEPEIYEGI